MTDTSNYVIADTIFESRTTLVRRATRSNGGHVVLKTPIRGGRAESNVERYQREFDLLRSIDDPLVIRVHALELTDVEPVLVLEHFDGAVTLRAFLEEVCWPSPSMLRLWLRLTEAIAVIHDHNIVHKDINPSNVLIHTTSHTVKIIDFGCASRFGFSEQAFQSPTSLEGTLPYISPEQTGRANRSLDERSDFYSLGITFYQIASGQLPFRSTDALDLVYAHLARKATPLHE